MLGEARRTNHLGFFLLRHLCLGIGRRGGARGTVMLTFVSSVHNPKIMLGMLVKVLCGHAIATRRRFPREGSVTFEDLMRGASDLDARTVTLEIVTSLRDLLSITVGIVTVITAMRSVVLSCSHETFCHDGEVGSLSDESVSEDLRSRAVSRRFSVRRQLFRAGTLDGAALISNSFLMQCPAEFGVSVTGNKSNYVCGPG